MLNKLSNVLLILRYLLKVKLRYIVIAKRAAIPWISYMKKGATISIGKHSRVAINSVEMSNFSRIVVEEHGNLILGQRVFLNINCSIICKQSIYIGNNVLIGENVKIYDHNHVYKPQLEPHRFNCAPIYIADNVWIGSNATILKGVTIGENTVIGAGVIVIKDVPANTLLYQKQNLEMKKK